MRVFDYEKHKQMIRNKTSLLKRTSHEVRPIGTRSMDEVIALAYRIWVQWSDDFISGRVEKLGPRHYYIHHSNGNPDIFNRSNIKYTLILIMYKQNDATAAAAEAVVEGISNAFFHEIYNEYVFYTDNPDDMGRIFERVIDSPALRAYLNKAYTRYPDEGSVECTDKIICRIR